MDDVLPLLSALIGIPSVNPMGRAADGPEFFEGRLTDFLESWLRPLDLEVHRQPVLPGRDNLVVRYRSPKKSAPHWLLEVHQDTVPVVGMTVPPFKATVEGDRVYGRGECDDKGPMTAMLLAVKRLAEQRPPDSANVTLALVVDEEFLFHGVKRLVQDDLGVDGAIVAEPTSLDVVVAHKGGARWEVQTPGVACHSSAPRRGVNAIYRMAKVLSVLEEYALVLEAHPPHPLLGGPTLSVGVIEGGVAVNVVPDSCRIHVDRRLIPGETPAGAHAHAEAYLRERLDFEFECRPPWLDLPAMPDDLNEGLCERLGSFVRPYRPGWRRLAEPYGSDASTLHWAGIPTVVFGPGSIRQAHTVDEWTPLGEIGEAAEILFAFCSGDAR